MIWNFNTKLSGKCRLANTKYSPGKKVVGTGYSRIFINDK